MGDGEVMVESASDGTEESHLDKTCVRASDTVRDACVTCDAKCDREARAEDDATVVTGEIAVVDGVGCVTRSATTCSTLTNSLLRRAPVVVSVETVV